MTIKVDKGVTARDKNLEKVIKANELGESKNLLDKVEAVETLTEVSQHFGSEVLPAAAEATQAGGSIPGQLSAGPTSK